MNLVDGLFWFMWVPTGFIKHFSNNVGDSVYICFDASIWNLWIYLSSRPHHHLYGSSYASVRYCFRLYIYWLALEMQISFFVTFNFTSDVLKHIYEGKQDQGLYCDIWWRIWWKEAWLIGSVMLWCADSIITNIIAIRST